MGSIDPSLLNIKVVCPLDKRYHGKCYSRKAKNVVKSQKLKNYQNFIAEHMRGRKFKNIDAVNLEMKKLGKLWKNKRRR